MVLNLAKGLHMKIQHSDATPGIKKTSPAVSSKSDSPVSAAHTAASTTSGTQPAKPNKLLKAVWRSQDRTHFIGFQDRASGSFRNVAVQSSEEAQNFAIAYSAAGLEAYFAIAEYASPASRSANNALGAWALIVDIDVGADKSSTGKGYATLDEAVTALNEFCIKAKVPRPNFVVSSGNGCHAYWVLADSLDRERWLVYAGKFKALMKSLGFCADPSRTSDMASVLRVPGTLNHKYSPPRPVSIISSDDEYIEIAPMLDAIDAAMLTVPVLANAPVVKLAQEGVPLEPVPLQVEIDREPPNLAALASALKVQSPDCDEKTWKFHRLAPMAYEARYFPALHDRLYKLARDWSSGDLGGIPSTKWNEPGSNGVSGKQCFDRVWKRFLTDNYTGKRVTLGTIFWSAQQEGWVYSQDDGGVADDKAVS